MALRLLSNISDEIQAGPKSPMRKRILLARYSETTSQARF